MFAYRTWSEWHCEQSADIRSDLRSNVNVLVVGQTKACSVLKETRPRDKGHVTSEILLLDLELLLL